LIVAPIQSGYGTSLIRELIPHELGGKVDLVFAAEGARCRIEIPLEERFSTLVSAGGFLCEADRR
jgi:two-component sensor histidine kinase